MANLSDIITPTNIVTASSTTTMTNKTINGSSNTLSNVPVGTATGTLPVANGGTGATTLTANNVLLGNGTSAPQAIAPSTSGNVLTSTGSTWASTAPAAGGTNGWELLSTVTASGASTADINISAAGAYDNYVLMGTNITTTGNGNSVAVQFKVGGTVQTSNYKYIRTRITSDTGSYLVTKDNVATYISLINNLGNATGRTAGFKLTIYSPNQAKTTVSTWESAGVNSSGDIGIDAGVGYLNLNSAVNGFRVLFSSGTFSGTFSLYGIAKS